MDKVRKVHADFLYLLEFKEQKVIDLFKDLREYILEIYPDRQRITLSYARIDNRFFNFRQIIRCILYAANLRESFELRF